MPRGYESNPKLNTYLREQEKYMQAGDVLVFQARGQFRDEFYKLAIVGSTDEAERRYPGSRTYKKA